MRKPMVEFRYMRRSSARNFIAWALRAGRMNTVAGPMIFVRLLGLTINTYPLVPDSFQPWRK